MERVTYRKWSLFGLRPCSLEARLSVRPLEESCELLVEEQLGAATCIRVLHDVEGIQESKDNISFQRVFVDEERVVLEQATHVRKTSPVQ